MAFNLNKSDESESKIDLSKKQTGASKFDLTKNQDEISADDKKTKKSKMPLLLLLGIVIIGTGLFIFNNPSNSNSENVNQDKSIEKNFSTGADSINTASVTKDSLENTDQHKNPEETTAIINDSIDSKTRNTCVNPTFKLNNKIPVTFTKGSVEITTVNESLVTETIIFLDKNPTSSLTINGYASSEGELKINKKIAQFRADSFKNYLVKKGISGTRINAIGKGIDNPTASNHTEDGRIKNRRVELFFNP